MNQTEKETRSLLARPGRPSNLPRRHRIGKIWRGLFLAATVFGILILGLLLLDVINDAFGYVALESRVPLSELTGAGTPLEALTVEEMQAILQERLRPARLRTLENEKPLAGRSSSELRELVTQEIVKPRVEQVWGLFESLARKEEIFAQAAEEHPKAEVVFMTWLDRAFVTSPQASDAMLAGVRTAILGSLMVIAITILVAFPTGIGAAIYLQEYAQDNRLNRLIQTNINNLAGVPSIIYGMLGLAIFVRLLSRLTSGALFGYANANPDSGRTILSAGLTMALLILPVIIINAQEAIKAVPGALRQASYGVGATRWQTVWHHVLPNAIPGILTGTILAISRAFGETAPLIIVGASTYAPFDPDGVFSRFTTLPIQIYQWASRPQDEFRAIAAAAIIVLLALLLVLNTIAILLRDRYSRTTL